MGKELAQAQEIQAILDGEKPKSVRNVALDLMAGVKKNSLLSRVNVLNREKE